MKRLITAVLSVLILCACNENSVKSRERETATYLNGVWLSYIELDKMVKSGDFAENFTAAVQNLKSFSVTDLFLHTSPFCDCIYKSEYYPLRSGYEKAGVDVLKTATEICHQNGIRVHAWLNPYRVKTANTDLSDLPNGSIAKKWAQDENRQNVLFANGVYLNPASSEVRRHIISFVREAVSKYRVDGVHFDDYFYPTTDADFDKSSYENYCKECKNPLSLTEYRTNAVNALISGCFTAIKFIDKDVTFSVSPAASVEKNLNNYYADVKTWCQNGCVDVIIPQLYFGFSYPDQRFCFDNLIGQWKDVTAGTGTKLCVGLAPYKIGTEQSPDCNEWADGVNVLKREAQTCSTDKDICGAVYFSYSSLFENGKLCAQDLSEISALVDTAALK